MTRGDFRDDLVLKYTEIGAASIFNPSTESTKINSLLNRALASYTRYTYSLYEPNHTITVSASSHTIETLPIWYPEKAVFDTTVLRNHHGTTRAEDWGWFHLSFPQHQTEALATPRFWLQLPNDKIMLFPTTPVSGTLYISGFKVHPTLNTDSSGDVLSISIPDDEIDDAALWCALKMMNPHMAGNDLYVQLKDKNAMAAARIEASRNDNRRMFSGIIRRGKAGIRRHHL